jgi:hypothetical protein
MDDRDRVGGAQRIRGLGHDAADFVDRQLPPAADAGGDRFPVYEAHDEVDQPHPLADRVDRDDVRMAQPRGGLGLSGEPLPDVLLEGELGRQHLDRHPALQPLVPGAIDHPHAPSADLAFDGISVAQSGGEAGGEGLVGWTGHDE